MRNFLLLPLTVLLFACASAQPQYHGFNDQGELDKQDEAVMRESSIGGPLDPMNLAQADQQYSHENVAYDRTEEGYYQWGRKLYTMGYRDEFYVRDLAPKAFHHDIMDTYDHAIAQGFEDAEKGKQ